MFVSALSDHRGCRPRTFVIGTTFWIFLRGSDTPLGAGDEELVDAVGRFNKFTGLDWDEVMLEVDAAGVCSTGGGLDLGLGDGTRASTKDWRFGSSFAGLCEKGQGFR